MNSLYLLPGVSWKSVVSEPGRVMLACFQWDKDQGLSSKAQGYRKLSLLLANEDINQLQFPIKNEIQSPAFCEPELHLSALVPCWAN